MQHDFELEPKATAPQAGQPAVRAEAAMVAPLQQAAGNAAFTRLVQQVRRTELTSQGAGPLNPEIGAAIEAERGGGSPLADPVRDEMEHHFGVDLSPVRLHTGPTATALNRSVQAEAFTTGTDIFLSSPNPSKELLGHELTHVVQGATGAAGADGTVSHPDDPAELQAREVGRAVADAAV